MLKRNKLLLTLLMLILTIGVIGCSGSDNASGNDDNNNNSDDNNSDNNEEEPNFNEEGLPVVDEKITLSVASGASSTAGSNWGEMEVIQTLEEDTNIELDIQLTPSGDWTEKRSILLGADELPDVLIGASPNELVDYGDQGSIIALNDLIEEYAPNIQKMLEEAPDVRRQITAPNGDIYGLPRANMAPWEATNGNLLWINTKWLDELGLDMPETLEDFKEALMAFKENDLNGTGSPDDQIPFSFQEPSTNEGLQKPIFTSFGTEHQSARVIVRDKGGENKVEYVSATEPFKEGVQYLRELWEEGLIDQEAFSYTSAQYRATLSQDPEIVGAFAGIEAGHSDKKWDYDLILPPLEGPHGDSSLAQNNPFIKSRMSITNDNEHPEATMRWLDYMYSEEMSLDIRYGPNGWEYGEDGETIKMIPPPDDLTAAEWAFADSPSTHWGQYISEEMAERMEFEDVEKAHLQYKRPEFLETSEEYVIDRKYPEIMNSLEELDVLSEVETTMKDYTGEMMAKWITEGGIEEEWDDYLDELDNMGLQEALDIYQEAYDRYLES